MVPSFATLAAATAPRLDHVALALANEFRDVDAVTALATLDRLGAELADAAAACDSTPHALARCCTDTLGVGHGFAGDQSEYDHPDNSMLDLVLTRRRGLPILLSIVYVETARRAGINIGPVGLPGHFVAAHFDAEPPLLLDPFSGGKVIDPQPELPPEHLRRWGAHEIAMRMLNNLTASYLRRGDLSAALRAATMRTALPASAEGRDTLQGELRAIQARLN